MLADNGTLLGYVRDITVAKLSSSNLSACEKNGDETAEFMQKIYDKLSELNKGTK